MIPGSCIEMVVDDALTYYQGNNNNIIIELLFDLGIRITSNLQFLKFTIFQFESLKSNVIISK